MKKINYKEEKAKKEHEGKLTVLKSNFNENINKLIKNIGVQKEVV